MGNFVYMRMSLNVQTIKVFFAHFFSIIYQATFSPTSLGRTSQSRLSFAIASPTTRKYQRLQGRV